MTSPPRRAWWKRKRWWAAGVLWLVVAYLLSVGPLFGLVYRGLLPSWAWGSMGLYTRPYTVLSGAARNPAADVMAWYVDIWLPEREPAPLPETPQPYRGMLGELPLVLPDPSAPASPTDPSDVPPLPSP
jgi:hypothetical protein